MLLLKKTLAVVAFTALSASSAMAGLVGTTVAFSASSTGTTQILSAGPGSATVGAGGEFAGCVGPANNVCGTSGMFFGIDISNASISINFGGSTFSSTGEFILDLTGFDESISAVALASSLNLLRGSFVLDSFTGDSIRFVGHANSGYNGTNGAHYTFDLTTTARLPEPASLALVGAALLAGAGVRRRRG